MIKKNEADSHHEEVPPKYIYSKGKKRGDEVDESRRLRGQTSQPELPSRHRLHRLTFARNKNLRLKLSKRFSLAYDDMKTRSDVNPS